MSRPLGPLTACSGRGRPRECPPSWLYLTAEAGSTDRWQTRDLGEVGEGRHAKRPATAGVGPVRGGEGVSNRCDR